MYGAILGDIIGSPYEFNQGPKSKEFPLFSRESYFTDDSVMTIAVAQGILTAGLEVTEPQMKEALEQFEGFRKQALLDNPPMSKEHCGMVCGHQL